MSWMSPLSISRAPRSSISPTHSSCFLFFASSKDGIEDKAFYIDIGPACAADDVLEFGNLDLLADAGRASA
jgi:hypothetical protein